MNTTQLAEFLKNRPDFMQNVAGWHTLPPREAVYGDYPGDLHPELKRLLMARGLVRPYSHQAEAINAALDGEDIVVVTPTASGKTLCYNVPVLQTIANDTSSRALYLFPTKALAADQMASLHALLGALGEESALDIKAYTYDGDTPGNARTKLRHAGHIVITNPDMLHTGILPHHTKWVKLFENLKYIVIDEVHAYRGIFGANLANVLRRLMRICAFYGSRPQCICLSATIANPGEFVSKLIGREVTVIDKNGAPAGEKHVVLYNPPIVNRELGIRKGSIPETRRIAGLLLKNDVQTIVFGRARLTVEVLVKYLKAMVADTLGEAGQVRGYRGGYLPTQRREIERGLRDGSIRCVVSTNALELGIDIGSLEACVLCGYPGTIASTWQQAGRAGRGQGTSLAIFVASSAPLDQYIMHHPEYLIGGSPENALVNPDNIHVLLNHIKCAAYELPFKKGESFGGDIDDALEYLEEIGLVRLVGDKYHWMTQEFPASEISLRSAADENFVIVDISSPHRRVIGEMDRFTVPMLLHKHAMYMQEGQQYQVEELDFNEHKAYVRRVDADYYTDADLNTSLKVLDIEEQKEEKNGILRAHGEVMVTSLVTMFKKIKFDTHENLGWGDVDIPEMEMHTTAYWMALPETLEQKYARDELQGALVGMANLMRHIAPIYLMCAPQDLHVVYRVRDPFTGRPAIYLYDGIAGGAGLSEKLYTLSEALLQRALELAEECPCEAGCPSCTGTSLEIGKNGKKTAMAILRTLTEA